MAWEVAAISVIVTPVRDGLNRPMDMEVGMAAKVSKKFEEFTQEVFPALIGTTRKDGSVQINPLWFEFKDGSFWVNGTSTRAWLKHLQRDPRVTLLLIDPRDMFRWAQVEGKMVRREEDAGGEHINHLSHRYLKRDYPNSRADRIKVQIEPQRITGAVDGER